MSGLLAAAGGVKSAARGGFAEERLCRSEH